MGLGGGAEAEGGSGKGRSRRSGHGEPARERRPGRPAPDRFAYRREDPAGATERLRG